MLRYPAAVLMGIAIQWFYLPGTTETPTQGIAQIFLVALGAAISYWYWYR